MTTYPSGISFPFRFAPAGGVAKSDAGTKVSNNLRALIFSAVKERLVRKNVGTIGYQRVMRNAAMTSSGLIKQLIIEAIAKYEPRAIGTTVNLYSYQDSDGMKVVADISFIFRNTGDPVTLSLELT